MLPTAAARPSAVDIRQIDAADLAVWQPLWGAYLAFYETDLGAEVYAATFARLTDPMGDLRGLIAWDGAAAVGLVHYFYHPTCWKVGPICYLQDLFTTPQARGRGVARTLMEMVFRIAAEAGAPEVYWTTAENNYRGRMLYDQVGVRTPFIKYRKAA